MKVAFIHPSAPYNEGTGATFSATQIIDGLADRGHTVVPYCTAEPERPDRIEGSYEVIRTDGFPYHTTTNLNSRIKSVTDDLAEFDVVHSYLTPSMPAMDYVSRQTAAATVVTLNAYAGICPKNDLRYFGREQCHDNSLSRCLRCVAATSGDHDTHGRAYRMLSMVGDIYNIRKTTPGALEIDGFHALSQHVKETYVEFDYPGDRIESIPNILDESFLVDHRSSFEEPFRLLYVGSVAKHKGVQLLPRLVDRLHSDTGTEYQLTVVGEGGFQRQLRRRTEDLGVADAVRFTGTVPNDELPEIYANHDLFVYPGQWEEPFGRVFLESLAAGTPVVASDVGGVRTILGDGGRVVERSVETFVDTIDEVASTGALPEMSRAATAKATQYRARNVVPEFETLYERVG